MAKRCCSCRHSLPEERFSKLAKSPDGRQPKCKSCVKLYYADHRAVLIARSLRWARNNPRQVLDAYLRRTYKITIDEYDQSLVKQGGKCAMCLAPSARGMGRWHVDHNHVTGQVRGLLCQNCNIGLGKLGDDPLKAANMLARYAVLANAN
jgi:hypothetical protein